MSAEEEESLLLAVVAAFSEADVSDAPPGGRWRSDDPTLWCVPRSDLRPVWGGGAAGRKVWTAAELADPSAAPAAAAEWRERGFVFVALPTEAAKRVTQVYAAAAAFFASCPLEAKERCTNSGFRYLGYQRREAFEKELVQVRLPARVAAAHRAEHWAPVLEEGAALGGAAARR
eukprot:gene39414-28525_t